MIECSESTDSFTLQHAYTYTAQADTLQAICYDVSHLCQGSDSEKEPSFIIMRAFTLAGLTVSQKSRSCHTFMIAFFLITDITKLFLTPTVQSHTLKHFYRTIIFPQAWNFTKNIALLGDSLQTITHTCAVIKAKVSVNRFSLQAVFKPPSGSADKPFFFPVKSQRTYSFNKTLRTWGKKKNFVMTGIWFSM